MKDKQLPTLFLKEGREVEYHNQLSKCRGNWIVVGGNDDDSPGILYCCGKHKVAVFRQYDNAEYQSSTYRTEALKFFNEKTGYFEIDEDWKGRIIN